MSNNDVQKLITFVLYLDNDNDNIDSCLENLNNINKGIANIIIFIDTNNETLIKKIDDFLNNNKNTINNFILLKNNNHMGISVCYNSARDFINSKYVMFTHSYLKIKNELIENINVLDGINYDVISFSTKKPHPYVENAFSYDRLNLNLLLTIHNDSIFNKIFSTDFLNKSEITFENNSWYPDLFLLEVLLNFKNWKYFNEQLVESNVNYFPFRFNTYDLLFQIKEMSTIVKENKRLSRFKEEIVFWFIVICKNSFLLNITNKYEKENIKNNVDIQKTIIKLASRNAQKTLNDLSINFTKNKYYKSTEQFFLKLSNQ